MCNLVSHLAMEIVPATSGAELVLELAHALPIDLVITDMTISWMTGLDVAQLARNSGLMMPFILLAEFPNDDLRSKVTRLGSATLLTKPFRPEDLLSLIREQLFPSAASSAA